MVCHTGLTHYASCKGGLDANTSVIKPACEADSGYGSSPPDSDGASQVSQPSGFYSIQASTSSSLSLTTSDNGNNLCQPGFSQGEKDIYGWVQGVQAQENDADRLSCVVPPEQRKHPRRTSQPNAAAVATACPQRSTPCSLTRQDDRAEGFVALLVGEQYCAQNVRQSLIHYSVFTAGLVEAIWPLSACPKRVDTRFYGGGVLPLKTFIQETLRRSKTSYSTLQVALYYIILLKNQLPHCDFTQEQTQCEGRRAMQCGRRMFLAALILASKYLQDRNYSTRAWSKISGLRTCEINQNEIQFLQAIEYDLHFKKEHFEHWSKIVIRLSARPSKVLAGQETCLNLAQQIGWDQVKARLTPDLPFDFAQYDTSPVAQLPSPPSEAYEPSEASDGSSPPSSASSGSAPTGALPWSEAGIIPNDFKAPRLHNLPTPQTTPFSKFANTPAVSAKPLRCTASTAAFSNIRKQCQASIDRCPPPQPLQTQAQQSAWCPFARVQRLRRSSPTRSVPSSVSSPESMVSDITYSSASTRSRSSSMSSNTSAFPFSRLAVGQICTSPKVPTTFEEAEEANVIPQLKHVSSTSSFGEMAPGELSELNFKREDAQVDPTVTANGSWLPSAACEDGMDSLKQYLSGSGHLELHALASICAKTTSSEIDAATALSQLRGQAVERPVTAIRQRASSDSKKVNVGPAKCHKRTHSKVNDALQSAVRADLRSTPADTGVVAPEIWDARVPQKQIPYRLTDDTKQPTPCGKGYTKRHCSSGSLDGGGPTAPSRAADMLQRTPWVRGCV